jgi:hypothetical protein
LATELPSVADRVDDERHEDVLLISPALKLLRAVTTCPNNRPARIGGRTTSSWSAPGLRKQWRVRDYAPIGQTYPLGMRLKRTVIVFGRPGGEGGISFCSGIIKGHTSSTS